MSASTPESTLLSVQQWRAEIEQQRRERRQGRDDVGYGEISGGAEFKDTTFLYIRATLDDDGRRPLPAGVRGTASPDMEIFEGTRRVHYLRPGRQQRVRVTIRNGGDLQAPSCSVDIFISTRLPGFSVVRAQRLGLQHVVVGSHEEVQVECAFTTPPLPWWWFFWLRQYRLAARVCSVSTRDYPDDADSLDPREHRQVARWDTWSFLWLFRGVLRSRQNARTATATRR
jgi:hypothetical protein